MEHIIIIANIFFTVFIINTMLKYPPIKPKAITDLLIYTHQNKTPLGTTRIRGKMYSLSKGKECATFMCETDSLELKTEKPSLYIDFLKSYERNKGYGTKLLNYAILLSKELGCDGNIYLNATEVLSPKSVPHIFYRKFGMNTGNKNIDKKLDKFIRKGKNATEKDFQSINMYYPPIPYQKTSFADDIKSIFGIFK